jgi:hypothetical protein
VASQITINGQTYSSVEQMPADVRRQYDAAMQLLSKKPDLLSDASPGDVSISTTGGGDLAHPTFKTVTQMTTSRIVINGKEYARWDDVPAEARAAFQSAGVQPELHRAPGARRVADRAAIANAHQLNYSSSSRISLSLTTLIILLIIILLLGVFVGHLLR